MASNIHLAGYCVASTDHADAPVVRGLNRGLRTGSDDFDNRNAGNVPYDIRGTGADRIAGNDNELNLLLLQKTNNLAGIADDGFR